MWNKRAPFPTTVLEHSCLRSAAAGVVNSEDRDATRFRLRLRLRFSGDETSPGSNLSSRARLDLNLNLNLYYLVRYLLHTSYYQGGKKMDALELLKQDHETVKDLFEEAEEADENELEAICQQIKAQLETHAHIEETVFYPAMEKYDELKEMVRESLKEHNQIKNLLREMDSIGADAEQLEAKLEELMETVEHHAEDEEEGNMFPKIREICDQAALEKLGEQLEAAKTQNQPQRRAG
jgi:hemerythrin superfamily protein